MPKTKKKTADPKKLRARAERLLEQDSRHIKSIPAEEIQDLVHELHVHQVELELQNEELRRAQQELEASRVKYFELYDFAPVGYFTFDRKKFIREVNLTGAKLLGVERGFLIGTPFADYISNDYFEEFYAHIRKVFATRKKQSCELKLIKKDGSHFFVAMESVALWDQEGNFTRCLSAINDINARKLAEEALHKTQQELEKKVQKRTGQLAQSNEELRAEIAERKQFEDTLKANEARYRNLFTNTPISIWEEDFTAVGEWLEKLRAEGVRSLREYLKVQPEALKKAVDLIRILDVNQATVDLLEAESKAELLSRFQDLFTDETYEAFTEELLAIWEGQHRIEIEVTGVTLKGNRIDCILRWFAPKRSGRLDLSNVIIAFSNITALKKASEEVRLLFNVTQAIHEVEDFHSAVGIALDEICRYTGWDYGEVWLPVTESKVVEYNSSWCVDSSVLRKFSQFSQGMTFRKKEGLPGHVWSSRKAEWCEDLSIEPFDIFERAQSALKAGLKTALGLPIVDNGQVLAVLVFIMFEKRRKDERLIELMSAVAAQLGAVLQRKKAEEALSRTRERYKRLVEASPAAIMVEQDGHLVYANPRALQLLGFDSSAEIEKRSLTDMFHQDSQQSVQKLLSKKKLPASGLEGALMRKDGRPIDVESLFIRTTYQGEPAVLALALDITEKKELQKQARRMERLSTLGEISASIAHEIRNPLSVLTLNLGYLEKRLNIPDKLHDRLDDIKNSVSRVENIIESILSFARPAKPKLTKVDLHMILNSSLDMVRNELKQSNIRVNKSYKADGSHVEVDINQIIQVFVNLFANARDAMQSGGGITLKTISQQDELEVLVKDSGKGIAPEDLDKIFEPFFTTRKKGTGLGMAIVNRILEQHKANISVESKIDKGTTFTIRFPLALE